MAKFSKRFAAGDPEGRRSSEWLVVWKDNTSDVYLAGRTMGGLMRVSLHGLGQCHVHGPGAEAWGSPGSAPRYLDLWRIDPAAIYSFPFAVVFPGNQLRAADWKKHRERGTVWLPVGEGEMLEVGLFLVRSDADQSDAMAAAGWSTVLVNERLPDGRRLIVATGRGRPTEFQLKQIADFHAYAAPIAAGFATKPSNLRGVLFATDSNGTRRFIEVAAGP